MDAFRIALTEEPKFFIKQKHRQAYQLSILLSPFNIETPFMLILQKYVDKILKNHYIISKKISITNGKNIYMKQVRNQQ